MMKGLAVLSILLGITMSALGQSASSAGALLARKYHNGETLRYRMRGVDGENHFEVQAKGAVRKDRGGNYLEEYAWSDLVIDGVKRVLSPSGTRFRQILSLDPNHIPSIPNLSQVDPALVGPITDLLTFYSDLWVVRRSGKLAHAGDNFYQTHGTAASWADGKYIVLGEDSIDFDITLKEVSESKRIATLQIRHLPPKQPQVKLPAAWMRRAVSDTPNNWVNVTNRAGVYTAGVGKETFDVELQVSLVDGRIMLGTINNLVRAEERDCEDEALAKCGTPRPRQISRQIEIRLEQSRASSKR